MSNGPAGDLLLEKYQRHYRQIHSGVRYCASSWHVLPRRSRMLCLWRHHHSLEEISAPGWRRLGLAEAGPKFLVGRNGLHDFSIRAGFGVYYNRDQEEESLQNLLDPPFAIESQGVSDYGAHPGFANPYADVAGGGTFTNKFPFTPAKAGSAVNFENYFPDNLSNVTPGYRPPYTYNYNLNIQRQLSPSTLLQIGYVGSVAHDLPREFEGDPITAAGHAACVASVDCSGAYRAVQHLAFPQNATQPALIPGTTVPWYLSIGNQVSDGSSNYNSLQVEVTRAPSHGLTFRLAYTYAHSLDDASGYESSSGAKGVTTNFVPGYEYLNYGDSDYDYRQRLVATYNYQVPIFASWNENRIARETIAGWHFTGITGLQGGFPSPSLKAACSTPCGATPIPTTAAPMFLSCPASTSKNWTRAAPRISISIRPSSVRNPSGHSATPNATSSTARATTTTT